jgi:uncharacterized membrane protein
MGLLRNPRALLEYVRGSLLFAPGLSVIVAVAIGLVLSRPEFDLGGSPAPFFGGGASGAQGLLQAITTAVITVTTLTFSLTVIALQLASSQYSPRLLRGFLRDHGTQAVLSILLATAAYSLIVLGSIRPPEDPGGESVPEVAVSLAVLLALTSIAALVYFLDHVTTEIRVDTMLVKVRDATGETIQRLFPEKPSNLAPDPTPEPPEGAAALIATRSGFLQDADVDGICDLAAQHEVSLLLRPRVGDAVVRGTPVGWIWPAPGVEALDDLAHLLDQHLTIGFERTAAQDYAFGFRQLTDVATRALSPGVNDPTTARHVTVQLTHLLCLLAPRPMGDVLAVSADGRFIRRFPRQGFAEILEDSVSPLRWYGNQDVDVVSSAFRMLSEVHALCSSSERRSLVRRQALLLLDSCRQAHSGDDLRRIEELAAPLLTS